jgi:hypothetical protein
MEVKELRIGNYIDTGLGLQAAVPNLFSCLDSIENDCKPILLTVGWLDKFGFELLDGERWVKGLLLEPLYCYDLEIEVINNINLNGFYYFNNQHAVKINHVHQLQNLYFALTGQELEMKK